jgi:esterase/lipase
MCIRDRPSALLRATVDDWRAAIRIAYRHLQREVGPDTRLLLVGYSNGGALAVDLVLDSLADGSLRTPERVVLFSPAIGITRAAALARAHRLLSFMPWFNKLAWKDIEPEYDPFKYNSFPTDAGYQTHLLTRSVRHRLAELDGTEAGVRFPPILTFMSLADATVLVEAVVEGLYDRVGTAQSELVIFDINRQAQMLGFFRADPSTRLQTLIDRPSTPYRLTVITNIDPMSEALVEWSRPAGSETPVITNLDLAWPRGTYSLSHVAVPFPPDDPIYGAAPDQENLFGVQLGTIEPRGERGLLAVPADLLTRLRSNPFFPYVERRLIETTE